MKNLYETNQEFKSYVDKYAKANHVSVEIALTHAMVLNYAKWLTENHEQNSVMR